MHQRTECGGAAAWRFLALACAAATSCGSPPAATADEPAVVRAAPESENERSVRELLARMGVRFLRDERRLEVSGWVNMQTGAVEVFACAPEGKTHESVVVLDCVPSGLHAGLLALGLEPGTPFGMNADGSRSPPTGDPVVIRVQWKAPDGEARSCRAEEWIWDQKSGAPMPPTAWIFAGSCLQRPTSDADEARYAANDVKSLVTTYQDSTTILENPWEGGGDDAIYSSNDRVVPPVGTPVVVTFARNP